MDSHEQDELQEQTSEHLVDHTGSGFDQHVPFLTFFQQSPTPVLNLEDSLTESTFVQQSQSTENVVSDLTQLALLGNGAIHFDDSVLDHFPQQEMLDSDILGRASPFSDTQWELLPGRATLTQGYLQSMESLILPPSPFIRQEMPRLGQQGFTLSPNDLASYLRTTDFEHAGAYDEMLGIVSMAQMTLPSAQNTPDLCPRVLEVERHNDPRSVTNLVDETIRGAHRGPFPTTPVSSTGTGLTVPSTRSALSSSSRNSRNTRRSQNALKRPDEVHNAQCLDCGNYYSKKELPKHRRCHGPRELPCTKPGCGLLFRDKKEKERHYRQTGHGGPGLKAETIYCQRGNCAGRKVSRNDNIRRHNRNFHPELDRPASDSASVIDGPSSSQTT